MTDAPPDNSLGIRVLPQPSDTVCGPTCLHALYAYFGQSMPLEKLIEEVAPLPDGGCLAVQLGDHALSRGFSATIYTNNLQTFDPTWFRAGVDLSERLAGQLAAKPTDLKLKLATQFYLKFLRDGGQVKLECLTIELLRSYIDRKIPILAGLSATYLYECPRETLQGAFDDLAGEPTGHFVVIRGYDMDSDHVLVADPLPNIPGFPERYYSVEIHRLLAAILLGIVTYDANLLIIEPKEETWVSSS